MNLMAQTCGIIILITLILFYFGQKKLQLRTERMYSAMLIISLVIHLLDVVSLHFIRFQEKFSSAIVQGVCKAYLVFLVAILAAVLIYISEDVYSTRKAFYRNIVSQMFIITIGIVMIVVAPIKIFVEGSVMYTYGPSALFTYGIAFYCICLIVGITIYYRKRINADRVRAVLIWMASWCAAALIQFFNPKLLLVSFAVSVGMVILYIRLENPGMNIDRQSGVFNQNALIEYLKQKESLGKNVAIVMFQLEQNTLSMYGNRFNWEQLEQTLQAKDAVLFRKSEDSGVLVFPNTELAREWEHEYAIKLKAQKEENYYYLTHALWISIYDTKIFNGVDELLYYLRYVTIAQLYNSEKVVHNHIITDEEDVAWMRREKEAEQLIDDAIASDRVEVFYQPIYSTEDEKFTSAEALVRIRDMEGNIVSPASFIPVAEKTGKIILLGNIVFEKVCRFISEKKPEKLGVDYIEVNLSPVQCSDDKLAETYIALMEKYHVSPKKINLEITETATFKRKENVMQNIEKLMEYRISFSLDDFGTGHSNLNYIVDMPVDIVKFDRGMTGAFFVDAKAHYVVEAAMSMIHGLGLKIVSEGIETKQQFETIRDLGISYVQGFYFSKPLPEQEFCQFVKQNNF